MKFKNYERPYFDTKASDSSWDDLTRLLLLQAMKIKNEENSSEMCVHFCVINGHNLVEYFPNY